MDSAFLLRPFRKAGIALSTKEQLPQQGQVVDRETHYLARTTFWLLRLLFILGIVFILERATRVYLSVQRAGWTSPPPLSLGNSRGATVHHYIPAISTAAPVIKASTSKAQMAVSSAAPPAFNALTSTTVRPSSSSSTSQPSSQTSTTSTSNKPTSTDLPTALDGSSSSSIRPPPPSHSFPELPSIRKAIVVASISSENTTWLREGFPDWEKDIYQVDNSSAELTVSQNSGHEASVYLTYLIDNFDNLPDFIIFSHANRYQWHNDDPMYDGINPIKNLQLAHVVEEGYVSLRCQWWEGCPVAIRPDKDFPEEMFDVERTMYEAYETLFPGRPVPEILGVTCCAQFAVSRAAVLKREKYEYMRMRSWLWGDGYEVADFKTGRVFEHLWHVIFGKDDTYCPDAQECYCKTYGLCDLICPEGDYNGDSEFCLGRYQNLDWFISINDSTWPEEGQGEGGRPVDGWWEEYYPPNLYDGFTLREDIAV